MTNSVHIATGYDPDAMQTEIVGAGSRRQDARGLLLEHRDMLDQTSPGHSIRLFVEEWEGGTFLSQLELRRDGWWLSESPLFIPIKETP